MTNNPYELYHVGLGWDASVDTDFLAHYGVLGMKWGARRYQNYDGTYTQRGMKRYNETSDRYEALKTKYEQTKDKKTKNQMKQAKDDMRSAYKRVKTGRHIDKGKKLAAENKSYADIAGKYLITDAAIGIGGMAANRVINSVAGESTRNVARAAVRGATAVASLSNVALSVNDAYNLSQYRKA